jgi:hypothetical protein
VLANGDSTLLPWRYSSTPTTEESAGVGQIQPKQDCVDPIARTDCDAPYLRLVRKGGNQNGFLTAIDQPIEADVSSYQRVRLQAEVKVVAQSLSKAGAIGTECPLLIRVEYTNTAGENLLRDYCYWAFEYPDRAGVISNLPHISTTRLEPNVWRTIDIDLTQHIDGLLEIRQISFQANGHDYESHVRGARLVGEGLREVGP